MHQKPKKRLGQNFLTDRNIRNKIVTACGFEKSDTVLEIGSGKGELTLEVARLVDKIYALEIDSGLCDTLKKNLKGCANIEVINQDFLKFDIKKHFSGSRGKIKIIGNIPYYITSAIIQHLVKNRELIESIFLTVQKEFAKRIIAYPGRKDYGSFSCFVQYHFAPRLLFNIKNASFTPAPKVDSCFLTLDPFGERPLSRKEEELLFKIIRGAFSKRRKTLKNGLKGIISVDKLVVFSRKFEISTNIRPEDLSLDDFINLAKS
ncbi:MAG: 16S rRNA (adenine(1518)-N(6)/adenine(1519)-N(6))-dimethyltransferase RsmA [Candidatus Omnitrophota bacterium]